MFDSVWQKNAALLRPLSIGFCGAGGKTTSLYLLSEKIINMHQKVFITTTTKMFLPENKTKIKIVIRETFDETDLNDVDICQWFGSVKDEIKGQAPLLGEIAKMNNYSNVWKLLEIDGARMKPLKAPNAAEPVYVEGLDLVYGVVSAGVFGKSVNDELIHRLERFTDLTHAALGDPITPEIIALLINEEKGLFQHLPDGVDGVVLVTQVKREHGAFIERLRALSNREIEVIPWMESPTTANLESLY